MSRQSGLGGCDFINLSIWFAHLSAFRENPTRKRNGGKEMGTREKKWVHSTFSREGPALDVLKCVGEFGVSCRSLGLELFLHTDHERDIKHVFSALHFEHPRNSVGPLFEVSDHREILRTSFARFVNGNGVRAEPLQEIRMLVVGEVCVLLQSSWLTPRRAAAALRHSTGNCVLAVRVNTFRAIFRVGACGSTIPRSLRDANSLAAAAVTPSPGGRRGTRAIGGTMLNRRAPP
jgi:hypothetical protein